MNNQSHHIEYDKWEHVVTTAQLVIACFVCAVEVVNNALLYFTRSQGYGPDTIVIKLLRYLVLTSAVNFALVIFSKKVVLKNRDKEKKKYWLMICTTLICTNVAFSHYQFATVLVMFIVPIMISILYEDQSLSSYTFGVSLVGESVAIIARALDPVYRKDIGPEAAIAYSFTITIYIFAKMINNTLFQRRQELSQAIIKNEKANAAAEKMIFSLKMLETLAGTIDAKDKYTNGHSMRVSIYATTLAEALGWDKDRVAMLKYESLLHDIGKIGVPDVVLNKPARLTETEFDIIKSHTLVGADILKNMVAVPGAYEAAKYHHERFDGKGYPSGLAGDEIPINARIICIADSYDAMSSDRIYRKALSREIIREELIKGRGTQFDPDFLDVFLKLFDEHKLVINLDTTLSVEENSEQQNVIDDIEKVIWRMSSVEEQKSSVYDFDKFYKYMRNIGIRYNRSVEVLSVDLKAKSEDTSFEKVDIAADVLQVAIKKNIRSVDVYYKYSASRHMIILLDAGVENIGIIKNRIQFDYETNDSSNEYELVFGLNESIK